jgi:hypothetical protein
MPTQQTILTFKEGVKALQQARDFASLRETIDRMVSLCPPEDVPLAKDAIARVIRTKQAEELNASRGNTQVLDALDKKYRDLYIVLRTSQSKLPPTPPPALPNGGMPRAPQTQMQKVNPLAGLNLPSMVADWLKSKKKYLITGGAVMSTLGGAVLLYKYFNGDEETKTQDSKESNFDRTIRSIQKYRAFSQMANDPNFSGNFTEILDGSYSNSKKKKKVKKKEEPLKSNEWERNEKTLMKDMDEAFNALSVRPRLEYELPQLPAPKSINPDDVVGGEIVIQETKVEKPKQRKKRKVKTKKTNLSVGPSSSSGPSSSLTPVSEKPKTRKPRKPKAVSESSPEKKVKKVKKVESTSSSTPGRLIPIVKRTKRVKKVKA